MFDADSSGFLSCLDEFIKITEEILSKLREELQWIKSHHFRCNVAKTGGTTASVIGSIILISGLLMTPITGGISYIAATGLGSTLAILGAAVNLTTDLTDSVTERFSTSRIDAICAERNSVVKLLANYLNGINEIVNELKNNGVDEESAFVSAVRVVKFLKKGNDVKASIFNIKNLAQIARISKTSDNLVINNGGLVWKNMQTQSEKLVNILNRLGFEVTKNGTMTAVRTGHAFISAFAFLDVYWLVKSISNDHPTGKIISDIIKRIQLELDDIVALKAIIKDDLPIDEYETWVLV